MQDQIPVFRNYRTALQDLAAKGDNENMNIWSLCVCMCASHLHSVCNFFPKLDSLPLEKIIQYLLRQIDCWHDY